MASEIKVNRITPITDCGTTILGESGDSVQVEGNLKSNALKATDGGSIISQSGTTITIGASGDTVSLASGASQSGFGRAGSVNWQTTIKTGDFTAVSGEGYFINTTSGIVTMTLPSSPSVGDIVAFKDYAGTFQTNNLTIDRNGSNIIGGVLNPVIAVEGQSVVLVYGDATQGWQAVEAATNADLPRPAFITASGGTITQSGNCKIHTFTGPGTFTVCAVATDAANNQVSYMVVAGGGAGGGSPSGEGGGGGGAGGFREDKSPVTPYTASPLEGAGPITVTATTFPITVGGGAAIGSNNTGSNSTFSTITSAGGGSGGAAHNDGGNNGGSGGGGTGRSGAPAGNGNTPPVSPSQGNNGSPATPSPTNPDRGGAGGGAGATGGSTTANAGFGGDGVTTSINGSPTAFAGGGGGAKDNDTPNSGTGGDGGTGGGGQGGSTDGSPRPATAGTVNTGGGGGGQAHNPLPAGAGGSGIVIIRYRFQ